MLTRALIVVLVVLNLGVALWWWLHTPYVTPLPSQAAHIALLQLSPPVADRPESVEPPPPRLPDPILSQEQVLQQFALIIPIPAAPTVPDPVDLQNTTEEAPETEIQPVSAIETTAPAAPIVAAPPAEPPAPKRCISLGPFTDLTQAQQAQHTLDSELSRARLREIVTPSDIRHRIFIPPAPNRAQAQAQAERIARAGFSDYFIINEGEDMNAIALGQFRNLQGAQSRLSELKAAGFEVQMRTTEEEPRSLWWLDAAVMTTTSPQTLQQRSHAAEWQAMKCTDLP